MIARRYVKRAQALGMCGEGEAGRIYKRYIAVNASWIVGSLGTLVLDLCIFVQFFMYRDDEGDSDLESEEGVEVDGR